ncbi:hypothetical protein OEZ86_000424 [Tetradesmus obliquus]|nr:hypothetical protein OEZ86_000424 [Tetradesmus obliquus]
MADDASKGSGRGSGGARKFAPTVPSRRRKAEEGSGAAPSAAEAAAANEAFQDLIRAAQSESKWERGRGRGFGRGRGGYAPHMVTFGGGDDAGMRPMGSAPQPLARGAPGVKQQAGSSSAAAKHEGKAASKSKLKLDPEGKAPASFDSIAEDDLDSEEAGPQFDYSQYYPGTLPLQLHHPEDDAGQPALQAMLMRQGVPQDLVLRQDDPEHTAQQLGLTDLSAAQDLLYLFQLPAVLPLSAPPKADAADARQRRGGSSSSSKAAGGMQQPAAAGVKELPSGKIGKLLIFQSGKVKMQIGDVLLDVTAGLPCVTRQDVAAVNTSSKHLVQLGPIAQRAVVCPDVWQLMAEGPPPEFPRAASVQKQAAAAAAANGMQTSSEAGEDDDEDMSGGDAAEAEAGKAKAPVAAAAAAVAAAASDGMDVDGQEEADSSSEQEDSEEAAPAAAPAPAAAAVAAAAPPPDDGVASLLGLPAGTVAAAGSGRGRGRFRPAAGPRGARAGK